MYKHKHVPKWTRGLITEYPGGIIGWVDDLPDEVIAENFPVSPIIPYDEELVKLLLAQIEHRSRDTQEYLDMLNAIEIEICEAVFDETIDRIVEQAFPRNVTSCRNHFGRRCVFYDACWNSIVRKDPIASGLYKRKEPLDAETDTRSSED